MVDPEVAVGRRLGAVALAVALVPYLLLVARFDFVCDDAYITFRYAQNVAAGEGAVFNPGERVEGYSEPLWMVAMAAVEVLGLDPAFWSRALSVLSGVALVALAVRLLAVRVAPTPVALLGGSLFLGTLPPLAVWSTGGLATAPFALAVLVLFERLYGRCDRAHAAHAALAASALVLLRADGAYWVAWIAGSAALHGFLRKRPALLRAAVVAAAASALVFGAHVAWRYSYYGDWLPNTARAKLGFSGRATSRGFDYLAHFLLTLPSIGLALALAAGMAKRTLPRLLVPLGVAVAATLTYGVVVGGDFMCYWRFFVPALPFVALAFGAALGALEERGLRAPAAGIAVVLSTSSILSAFDLHPVPRPAREAVYFRYNAPVEFRSELEQWTRMRAQAREWEDIGRALGEIARPGDSIVQAAVGAVAYYSGVRVFDRNGLVTREVALREPLPMPRSPGHDKTVPREFFKKERPTWMDAFVWPKGTELPAAARGRELEAREVPVLSGRRPGHVLFLEPYDGAGGGGGG